MSHCPFAKCYSGNIESIKRRRVLKRAISALLLFGVRMRVITMSERETNVEEIKVSGAFAEPKAPKSLEEARKDVKTRVRNSAAEIADGLIEAAKAGRLAEAKYLFEIAGVYPVSDEPDTEGGESVTRSLLKSLGLPTDRLDREEQRKREQ
jgi:hypothetical protein